MTNTANFIGVPCRKMQPTLKHRPALWECMLGTVYAMNEQGVTRYFDYDWKAAIKWAGISDTSDARLARHKRRVTFSRTGDSIDEPSFNKLVLWVIDTK